MTTTVEMKYTIDEFNTIDSQIEASEFINEDILKYIQELTSQVGSPNYSKTPVFSNMQKKSRRKKKSQEVSDDDWEAIRQFQTTDISRKKEGIEKDIDDLRVMLNKLTLDNLTMVIEEIMSKLDYMIKTYEKEEELILVGNMIFEIASSNKFYSSIYAELYEKIMKKHDIFKVIFSKNYQDFTSIFDDFEYVGETENYDKFCEFNKKNEKRRALSSFFINLMKLNIIEQDSIVQIIKNLQSLLLEEIKNDNKKELCEEISETLYVIVLEGSEILDEHDEWEEIHNCIKEISEMNNDDQPSLSNKVIFKHLDIIDEL
tara:strand:- start:982 stop:1929 length:948 start_codon:yes stop_codon:yes gene_type:complete